MKELLTEAVRAALKAGDVIMDVYNHIDISVDLKEDNTPITAADRAAHSVIEEMLARTGLPFFSEEGKQADYAVRSGWDRFWLVDPLDGTKEFIKRNGEFTVNIALIEKGIPVAGVVYVPVTGVLYCGAQGLGAWRCAAPEPDDSWSNIVEKSEKLPLEQNRDTYILVGSRSFQTEETDSYFEKCRSENPAVDTVSVGSSLKLCMVAEGTADEYPRLGTINEWDTAAGDALVRASGGTVTLWESGDDLLYNKESMRNPWFIAKRVQ